uniref:Uncharacterized protein n=1 Tax=Chromera velia CCMP2878 TaxID=1169474 RepID=A0A0G4I7U9_9ALVE|eukprot:Cvel_11692.t1-p1 / transcript=Cvel_11692.t1 / gene=Cvel_11692 / organism=Chromera_velia_CCMP2878 / gene_product=hypothetical protein / transcript_product=hypothetical protein / location=Cvel_scaffold741:31101-35752(+) / protein_length=197 / sequence_SO=supercontig / SO=protein_coding / is_pseudo=false
MTRYESPLAEEALEGWEGGMKVEVDLTQPISSKKPSKSFSFVVKVTDLKFADDLGAPNPSEQRMQELANRLQPAYKRWGLQISIKKTEILVQPAAGEERHAGNPCPSPISINATLYEAQQQYEKTGGIDDVKLLLKYGAKTNMVVEGETLLTRVSKKKQRIAMQHILLDGNADPCLKNGWGEAPIVLVLKVDSQNSL